MPINLSAVKLKALAAHIKLSVGVYARQQGAAVQAAVIERVIKYVELRAGVDATTLSAQAQYMLMKVDAIVGEFLKVIALAESLALSDAQLKDLDKVLEDAFALTDIAVSEVTKAVADDTLLLDFAELDVVKGLDDAQTALDVAFQDFTKALALEALYASDSAKVVPNKALVEAVYQVEGPAFGQSYADPTYFAEDYSWDGSPIKAVDKALSETLSATDDFLGEANVDDDQTVFMTKTVVDTAVISDLVGKAFVRPGVVDTAVVGDSALVSPYKGLSETLSVTADEKAISVTKTTTETAVVSELVSKAFERSGVVDAAAVSDVAVVIPDKGLTDSFGLADSVARTASKTQDESLTSADSQIRLTDKVLSEFPLSAIDLKTFSLDRVSVDSASLSDVMALSLARDVSDTFGQTDLTTKSTNKAPTDTGTTSDSGSLRKTDYTDITYFAEDYVGSSLNF